ncbi:Nn.00g022670.m01.CDS01 [Neocucurbitaria sp. VM-36]
MTAKDMPFPKAFRFLDLPAEIRIYIYQFVLPHDLTISFKLNSYGNKGQLRWFVHGSFKSGHPLVYDIGNPSSDIKTPATDHYPSVQTQLFVVNKYVSSEARAVLYGSNTYKFTVNGVAHYPISLQSPLVFGPFGDDTRLPLLRNLRSIHIDILLNDNSHWAVKRQRSRLEYLVSVLKEYADDENRKSLLQELKVTLRLGERNARLGVRNPAAYHLGPQPPAKKEKFLFSLESLASLSGIKHVEMTGLPDWYAQCLQLCMQGKGGEIQEMAWPLLQVKRRRDSWSRQTKHVWITTRKWYQPTLNWKEFAERNGIATPDDIERFWTADS